MTGRMELLVEGSEDSNIVYHLLAHYKLPIAERGRPFPGRISIDAGRGVDYLLESLPIRLKAMRTEQPTARLGIVLDADSDLQSRWAALQRRLIPFGYSGMAQAPVNEGTIVETPGLPIVGIWLMPNNQTSGEIEDFIQLLVPANDSLLPLAEQTVQALPPHERRFPVHDERKAIVHTWLAWQAEPGRPMGQAITKRYLDPTAPSAAQFVAWVRRVFAVPDAIDPNA